MTKEDLVNTSQLKSPYIHNRYNAEVKVLLSFKEPSQRDLGNCVAQVLLNVVLSPHVFFNAALKVQHFSTTVLSGVHDFFHHNTLAARMGFMI